MSSEQRSGTFADPQPVECAYFPSCDDSSVFEVTVEIVGEGTQKVVVCTDCTETHLGAEVTSASSARQLDPSER